MKATGSLSLADLIQAFFRRHLIATRGVSPHTLHAYRDAIRGLLTFAAARCSRSVVELSVDDLGRDTVLGFLDHLEQQRGNTAATRNARLAAIHSLQRFIAVEDPSALAICQQLLSIPYKRTPSRAVTCLAHADIEHLLTSIDRATALGRRDFALLQFLYNTGARAQEGHIVQTRVAAASISRPPLAKVRITPHTFRHTTASHLLQSGVELNVVRSWLGHASIETTHAYIEIDLEMKRAAIEACEPPGLNSLPPVWKDPDLLTWLEAL